MSTKEAHTLNHWWNMLYAARNEAGCMVSAGQVAKIAGTARSTAIKYLLKLVEKGVVLSYIGEHTNHSEATYYDVLPRYQGGGRQARVGD